MAFKQDRYPQKDQVNQSICVPINLELNITTTGFYYA